MKTKRVILIVVLIALSIGCYVIMDKKYDPLARYQYATSSNREIILQYMDDDDIDYIIQQQIKPEQFMDFIKLDGFDANNILYYDTCYNTRKEDREYIIEFSNKYRQTIEYKNLETLLTNYTYKQIDDFYSGAYTYIEDAKLVVDPTLLNTELSGKKVVYKYKPKNLVRIDNSVVPSASITSSSKIYVNKKVVAPLKNMLTALEKTNNKTCGGLILTSGYISYSEQIDLYEDALVTYGYDNVTKYVDYPGQSESQLGYTITFTISGLDEDEIEDSDQVKWLEENASKYGFVVRYPKNKLSETGKKYQPLTLRYVGDAAKDDGFDLNTFFGE